MKGSRDPRGRQGRPQEKDQRRGYHRGERPAREKVKTQSYTVVHTKQTDRQIGKHTCKCNSNNSKRTEKKKSFKKRKKKVGQWDRQKRVIFRHKHTVNIFSTFAYKTQPVVVGSSSYFSLPCHRRR